MSVSAVSGSVQIYSPITYPSVTLNSKNQGPQNTAAPTADDINPATQAIQKQQDDNQQQQTAQVQQVQSQNANQISVNFLA